MSGHSKWSKVKHQKATTDVVKGQLFTKASQAITLAVREGGGVGDPDANFRLRLAVEKAKAVNMPKENIDRAIKRAMGGEGNTLSENIYEGFGPSGSAFIINVVTDNPNRSVSAIKNLMDRSGGSMASPGAVSHMFSRVGMIIVQKDNHGFDDVLNLAVEAGADDVVEVDNSFEIFTAMQKLAEVKSFFEAKSLTILESDFIYLPHIRLELAPEKIRPVEKLVADLESLDDVVRVSTNVL